MWTPGVLCQKGGPMSFVLQQVRIGVILTHPQSLDFGPEALFGLYLDLGFQDVNVGVDDALVVGGDGRCERVEVKMEVRVLGFPFFVQLAAC